MLGGAVVFAATQDFWSAGGTKHAAPRPQVDRFDAARAWKLIVLALSYGQRPAGSPQLRALADRLRPLLPHGRFEDLGPQYPGMRNIVGDLPGRGPPILIGAHYDSQAQPEGFVGANDSAAGTAAVIELARVLRSPAARDGRAIRFVLFDAEEEPVGQTEDSNFANTALRGSRAYVARHAGEKLKEMILLDYIAHRGASFGAEGNSDFTLWQRLRAAAKAVGVGGLFPDRSQSVTIVDDHYPFITHGVTAIDIIDWGYASKNTVQDTIDKLDRKVLDGVGEAVAELVRRGG